MEHPDQQRTLESDVESPLQTVAVKLHWECNATMFGHHINLILVAN